ncbi:GNAT family N-acetyltransferase [Embleya sp. NPDC056575]|uniref:GNAT family N-acetyltransferase n=1 Tax=unclassified Embleya TaxID=2699296 RepID=UPI0036880C92
MPENVPQHWFASRRERSRSLIGFAHRAKGGAVLGAAPGHHGPFGADAPSGPGDIRLVPRPYTHFDTQRLLHALYAQQVALYGFADHPDTTEPRDLEPPEGLLVVAYAGTEPIGCGGWRTLPSRTAEIKRLYVVPEHRGRGCGRRLLATLEHTAAEAGARRLVVETGARNIRALALFAATGYTPRIPYVEGRDPAINRAMTKELFRTLGTRPLSAPPR